MTLRTSLTHPLQIPFVQPLDSTGRLGITFCPGKFQSTAITGGWDRDLDLDLDAVQAWGAAAVVTLIEDHELAALNVPSLGAEVRRRHMAWYHLPIPDVSVPGPAFAASWETIGESLRARVRDGFDIVVHCKGGLGRAGTVATQLMIELGTPPDKALAMVRTARPGAIETSGQVAYVRTLTAVASCPATDAAATLDRGVGALVGLAVGDAVGTTLEFEPRDSYAPVTDMTGGGPFRLKAGQWTDDTAMALALADSLLAHPDLDEADLMTRFVDWRQNGTYSCTGRCFDIGNTTAQALSRWRTTGNPVAGSRDPQSAGNGSLMRLAPVALRHWRDRNALADIAARQSRTTHAAPEAVDACVAYAGLLANAIGGMPRAEVLSPQMGNTCAGNIAAILSGSWRGKARQSVKSSGYVAHALEAALWCVGRTGSFSEAVLLAANLGDDADTTAAITGQLAGALYGVSAIPAEWLAKVAWHERIRCTATSLMSA